MSIRTLALLAALAGSGCTPGAAVSSPPGGGPGARTIDVNLTLHAPSQTAYGTSGGFAPAVTTVAVGTTIVFTNSDGAGISHTATLVPGAAAFPAASPLDFTFATHQSGTTISQPWSSGILTPGQTSQAIAIDRPGTYIYGCAFHYGAPMRGAIVAQ